MDCILLLFAVGYLGYHCVNKVIKLKRNEAARELKASNRKHDT